MCIHCGISFTPKNEREGNRKEEEKVRERRKEGMNE
jgi:hypothetical protein